MFLVKDSEDDEDAVIPEKELPGYAIHVEKENVAPSDIAVVENEDEDEDALDQLDEEALDALDKESCDKVKF